MNRPALEDVSSLACHVEGEVTAQQGHILPQAPSSVFKAVFKALCLNACVLPVFEPRVYAYTLHGIDRLTC